MVFFFLIGLVFSGGFVHASTLPVPLASPPGGSPVLVGAKAPIAPDDLALRDSEKDASRAIKAIHEMISIKKGVSSPRDEKEFNGEFEKAVTGNCVSMLRCSLWWRHCYDQTKSHRDVDEMLMWSLRFFMLLKCDLVVRPMGALTRQDIWQLLIDRFQVKLLWKSGKCWESAHPFSQKTVKAMICDLLEDMPRFAPQADWLPELFNLPSFDRLPAEAYKQVCGRRNQLLVKLFADPEAVKWAEIDPFML